MSAHNDGKIFLKRLHYDLWEALMTKRVSSMSLTSRCLTIGVLFEPSEESKDESNLMLSIT